VPFVKARHWPIHSGGQSFRLWFLVIFTLLSVEVTTSGTKWPWADNAQPTVRINVYFKRIAFFRAARKLGKDIAIQGSHSFAKANARRSANVRAVFTR